jgi:hypothetical protein
MVVLFVRAEEHSTAFFRLFDNFVKHWLLLHAQQL